MITRVCEKLTSPLIQENYTVEVISNHQTSGASVKYAIVDHAVSQVYEKTIAVICSVTHFFKVVRQLKTNVTVIIKWKN